METNVKQPERLQDFMDAVMSDISKSGLDSFLEWDDFTQEEYDEISEWFEQFGISLM